MEGINTWWKGNPGERFWLGVIGRYEKGDAIATPCGLGRNSASSKHPLITHVKHGDVVFHYDRALQAIVAWSAARGRARKTRLVWSMRSEGREPDSVRQRSIDSWAIGLESANALEGIVPLDQIARIQSERFPALRAFEDQVGGPLDYPFAMGSVSDTCLLAGHVFKLPALFVDWFPPLARVAARMEWSAVARTRANDRPQTESVAEGRNARAIPATA